MEKLSSLSPVEVLIYIAKSKLTFKELLKYTMMDMVVKQILKLEMSELDGDEVKYVTIGSEFKNYDPKSFEEPQLSPFTQDQELKVLFEHYVRMCHENVGSYKAHLFTRIIDNQDHTPNIKQGFFQRITNEYTLNSNGKRIKSKIEAELASLSEKLPELLKSDKEGLKKIIKAIGGNIFLVSGFNPSKLKKLDFTSPEEYDDSYYYDDYIWHYLLMDDFGTSFDTHMDTSMGCSGDSDGDNGCGGCD